MLSFDLAHRLREGQGEEAELAATYDDAAKAIRERGEQSGNDEVKKACAA